MTSKRAARKFRQRLVRYAADLYFTPDLLTRYTEFFESSLAVEDQRLATRFETELSSEEREWFEDCAADWNHEKGALVDLGFALGLVGLHRSVEITTREMVRHAFSGFDLDTVFSAKRFRKELLRFKFRFESTRQFKSFNELRCLSNAIKHQGKVAGDLAALPRWKRKKGQVLTDLKPHYDRLVPQISDYVAHLSRRLARHAS